MSDSPTNLDQETMSNLEYLGSILAVIVIISFTLLIILATIGYANLGRVPQSWFAAVIVPVVIMSAIEAFGQEVYNVFKNNK